MPSRNKLPVVCILALAVLSLGILPGPARAQVPTVSNPTVRLMYLIASNRTEQADGVANLQRAFLIYREWAREQMELNGFGPRMTFNVETEADGWTPKVYVVQSDKDDAYLAADMWNRCGAAADTATGGQFWDANNLWFVVGEAHIMQADGSLVGHYLGGTGNAQAGVAIVSGDCLAMSDPQYLTNNVDYNGLTIPEIGSYPMAYGVTFGTIEGSTLSSVGSTYLGADMHEFGHCFHLHHDFRNDWNFLGNVMGNGFRGMRGYIYPTRFPTNFVRSSYAFAIQRSLSRFFNPHRTVLDTTTPSISAVPTGVVSVVDGKAVLNFSVSDASGLGLAVLIDMNSGYGSGVLAEQRLSGTSTNFTICTPYYQTTTTVTNQLRVQDVFGNESSQTFVYSVTGVTNRCPWSNIKIVPPAPAAGQSVTFDASGSSDPDDSLSTVTVEWDFNNDDVYDTAPMACTSTYSTNFSAPGLRLVKVRLNDGRGGIWVSSPVGMRVGLVTHYVWTNSPQPEAPYDSWIKASHTIQEAVNASVDGDLVLAAPGTYDVGGSVTPGGTLTNRVCITNAITVRADAGPDVTLIVGASDGGGFGPAAIRCAFVGSNAVLDGFTLTNGCTMNSGDARRDQSGGGALVIGGSVTNCHLLANAANVYGGGSAVYYGGSVVNSTLDGNQAGSRGGGVDFEYSGGSSSRVQACEIRNNAANNYGGGVYCRGVGLVANSLIYGNTAGRYAGGVHLAYTSRVENCAIYGNSVTDTVTYGMGGGVMSEFNGPEVRSCTVADNSAGRLGGGLYIKDGTGTVVNSIFYFNTAPAEQNWGTTNATGSRVTYSCSTPTNGLPSGLACIEGDPLFENEAERDYRLTRYSSALDAGLNSAWASNACDVVGNPRITGAVIDMGAYENPSLFTPAVTTDPVTNVTAVTAESGGTVTDEGSYLVTARGLCWSTSMNPTVADVCTTNGSGIGAFSAVLTNLSPGVVYHVRAYAVNSVGTSYGEDRAFNTIALFTNISAGLTGVYFSAVAWGDVDNDGDLDILLSGYRSSSSLTRLYRNDGVAGFTNVTCGLPNCYYSALALSDYDRDGDLDVLISGTSTYMTRLYNNDGTGTFVNTGASFPQLYEGSAAWGDYDNDGDLDLLLTGHSLDATDGYRFTRIYRNDNGAFAAMESGLPAVYESSGSWGDYDRDGDLDVLISGDSTGGKITCVYANIGDGLFTNINAGLVGIDEGKAAWGDYDNDGYLDILLSGNATTRIYHNNGDGTFTDIDAGLQALSTAAVAWGDYDADGDLDAVVCGYSGTYRTYLYRKDGGTFSLVSDANLAGIYTGDIAWGDYDKDGRLDLLLAGSGSGGALAYVYRNQNGASNTPPATPSGLATATNGLSVTMSWNAAADGQTPSAGLTYNLRVGTTPGGDDVMTGMADTNSGWRRLPAMGNAGHNTSRSLNDLQGRTSYYWSVQAVDAAYAGGAWAAEGVFVAPCAPSVTTLPASNITATTADGGGDVTDQGDSPVITRGCVWSTNANPTITSHDGITTNGSGTGSFDSRLTGLVPATLTYHVRAYAVNGEGPGYGEDCTFSTLTTPPGNALDFDGTNDYVVVADADELDLTNSYTLECWFKPDSFGTLSGLISKYQTASANGCFVRLSTNNLVFDQLTTSNLNLQVGRWYHVAGVNSNGTRSLYLNGIEQALYGTPLAVRTNSDPLRLGSDFNGRYLDGQLDEARLWSVARTEAEIRDAMHKELNGNEAGLVAYYGFNSLSGTTLYDRTGHGLDGTLVNGPVWTNSTIPCAAIITNRTTLRAVWSAQTNSLASSRFRLDAGITQSAENVVFGHDGGTDDWIMTDLPPGMKRRLGRVWQMEGVGTSSVSVIIDVSGLTLPDASQLRLISNPNGVFADGASMTGGTLDGADFTVAGRTIESGRYYTLGEYYGIWYVDASRPDDSGDGMSWATAKRTLQAAVDVASSLDTIWVTNGVYDEGGAVTPGGALTNRVTITEDVRLLSMQGPEQTLIVGASDGGSNGPAAIRCVYVDGGGTLSGFTLTNGHTLTTGDWNDEQGGGGALVKGGIISNCVVSGCSAAHFAGGLDLFGGDAWNCVVAGNESYDGGGLKLETSQSEAFNCLVRDNWAGSRGGGAFFWQSGALIHCTVSGNAAGTNGGGVYCYQGGSNLNSIIYFNTTNGAANNYATNAGGAFGYSCTWPAVDGTGNITNDPLFAGGGDCHLLAGSPCMDAGTNIAGIVRDLDGVPRPLDGNADGTNTTDMGCYEFVNALADSDSDTMRDRWEVDHDLDPTDPSDANEDDDEDDYGNDEEHIADTDPHDSNDFLRVTGIEPAHSLAIQFLCTNSRSYLLQSSTNLTMGDWSPIAGPSNGAAGGTMSLIDTNDLGSGAYRIEVRLP